MSGKVYAPGMLTLCRHVGVARAGGRLYRLGVSVADKRPVIKSARTGRLWTISWDELVEQACAAGIDDPGTEPEGGPHAA